MVEASLNQLLVTTTNDPDLKDITNLLSEYKNLYLQSNFVPCISPYFHRNVRMKDHPRPLSFTEATKDLL